MDVLSDGPPGLLIGMSHMNTSQDSRITLLIFSQDILRTKHNLNPTLGPTVIISLFDDGPHPFTRLRCDIGVPRGFANIGFVNINNAKKMDVMATSIKKHLNLHYNIDI